MAHTLLDFEETGFEIEASSALANLRHAVIGLMSEVLGPGETRLTDLSRVLGIDNKLAWKLVRIMELRDPYSAGLYLPGPSGMRIVRQAATAKGASAQAMRALEEAEAELERVQRHHAGDRRTLDVLFAGLADQEQERHQLLSRRAAFQASAELWGVRAATRLMTFAVWMADHDASRIQMAHVAGMFAVERMRRHVPWRVAQVRAENDDGGASHVGRIRPIDPTVPVGEPAVLRSYTSPHAPALVPVDVGGGRLEFRLGPGEIGKQSRFDIVLAEYAGDAGSRYRTPTETQLSVASRNRTPVEHLILDLVLDRELYGRVTPSASLVSELWGERPADGQDDPEALPMFETVSRIGSGLRGLQHARVPQYGDLMSTVCQSRGVDPKRFDVYRLEMKYPPAPTAARIAFPLSAVAGERDG